jgi:hypothetical protein
LHEFFKVNGRYQFRWFKKLGRGNILYESEMNKLNENILIEGFLDHSLTSEQIVQFNNEYKNNPNFVLSVHKHLNIICAIKAADRMKEKIAGKKLKIAPFYRKINYQRLALAASILLVVSIIFSIYTSIRLNRIKKGSELTNFTEISKATFNNPAAVHSEPAIKFKKPGAVNFDKEKVSVSYVSALTNIIKELHNNENQSYTRGVNKAIHGFPENSKLANANDARLFIKNSETESNLSFLVSEYTSGDTLMNVPLKSRINIIELSQLKLERGKKYYWVVLKERSEIELGTISYCSGKEYRMMQKFELNSSADYVNAFVYYYESGYLFDSYAVLEQALRKYPKESAFINLSALIQGYKY